MSAIEKSTIFALIILIIMQANAMAEDSHPDPFKAANEAAAAGDHKQAYMEYLRLAKEENNALAMFSLGLIYKNGTGRSVDEGKACDWFGKAARRDIPFASHLFAECTQNGVNHPADSALAAKWYEKAADLGHHLSLCYLADLYMKGEGVAKDPTKALELCHNAVKKGSPPALVWMGKFYFQGDPSIRDPNTAIKWFEQATQYNLPEASYYIGWMLSLNAKEQNQTVTARGWFEKAASQGHVPSYAATGKLYFVGPVDSETGRLSEGDLAKAYMWLSAASQKSKDREEKVLVDKMLEEVRAVMPKTWAPDLDHQVEHHLAEYQ